MGRSGELLGKFGKLPGKLWIALKIHSVSETWFDYHQSDPTCGRRCTENLSRKPSRLRLLGRTGGFTTVLGQRFCGRPKRALIMSVISTFRRVFLSVPFIFATASASHRADRKKGEKLANKLYFYLCEATNLLQAPKPRKIKIRKK